MNGDSLLNVKFMNTCCHVPSPEIGSKECSSFHNHKTLYLEVKEGRCYTQPDDMYFGVVIDENEAYYTVKASTGQTIELPKKKSVNLSLASKRQNNKKQLK